MMTFSGQILSINKNPGKRGMVYRLNYINNLVTKLHRVLEI